MTRAISNAKILGTFGVGAEGEWDFARMVDREHSRSMTVNHIDTYDRQSYLSCMTDNHFSRSDIVRLVNVENDVFTVWLRHGLIVPIDAPAGRGKALRFDPSQVRIATVIANGRAAGLNLDALKAVAMPLQSALKTALGAGVSPATISAVIEEVEEPGSFEANLASLRRRFAQLGDERVRGSIAKYEDNNFKISVKDSASKLTADDIENLWLCLQLFECEGYLTVYYLSLEKKWRVDRRPVAEGARLPAPVCILLDMSAPNLAQNSTSAGPNNE